MSAPEQLPEFLHGADELFAVRGLQFWLPNVVAEWSATRAGGFQIRSCLDAVQRIELAIGELPDETPFFGGFAQFERVDLLPTSSQTALTTPHSLPRSKSTPPWLTQVTQRLERLISLPEGWNGYGSPAVRQTAAASALRMLLALRRGRPDLLPSLVPTHLGGIQLEWHHGDIDLEAEILPDLSVDIWYMDDHTDTERELHFESPDGAIRELDALLTIVEVRA
jgi:hypothetical protein